MIKTIPNCSVNYAIACFSQGDLYVLPVFVKRRELPGTWIPLPSYPQALQSSLQEQQKGLTYLSTAVEELSRKGPAEVSQSYRSELDVVLGRWKKLSAQLAEQCQKLEERMTRLQRFQVHHNFSASANSRRLVSVWLRQNTFRCLQELTPKWDIKTWQKNVFKFLLDADEYRFYFEFWFCGSFWLCCFISKKL